MMVTTDEQVIGIWNKHKLKGWAVTCSVKDADRAQSQLYSRGLPPLQQFSGLWLCRHPCQGVGPETAALHQHTAGEQGQVNGPLHTLKVSFRRTHLLHAHSEHTLSFARSFLICGAPSPSTLPSMKNCGIFAEYLSDRFPLTWPHTLQGQPGSVSHLRHSPNGDYLAAGSPCGTVKVKERCCHGQANCLFVCPFPA